ncbi:MAG: DUF58 domain-containing protein [Cryomorphaceae bacterium]|nr:DUF58 domain-containing protein [Cryomorphaceae bacterium]
MEYVLPNEYVFGSLEWLSKQMMDGFITGQHKSPYHGFSVEFSEHKMYNPGESTRHIDWKLYGKTDRLYTKRYEEETNLKCRILIDTSGSMFFPRKEEVSPVRPNKIQFSLFSAAMLLQLFRKQRDAFGLSLFDETFHFESDMASTRTHHRFLMNTMETWLQQSVTLRPKARIAEGLHRVADTQSKRSLIIIFSDFYCADEEEERQLFEAFQHIAYNKHDLVMVQVRDHKTEGMLELGTQPLKIVGMEGEGELKITPEEVKSAYLERSETFQKNFSSHCLQYGIDLVDADIQNDYLKVLQSLLVKRQKIR